MTLAPFRTTGLCSVIIIWLIKTAVTLLLSTNCCCKSELQNYSNYDKTLLKKFVIAIAPAKLIIEQFNIGDP